MNVHALVVAVLVSFALLVTQPDLLATDPPAFSIHDTQIIESNSGNQTAAFLVTLSSPGTEQLSVQFSTVQLPGTPWPDDYSNMPASAGSDFVHTNGFLIFEPGETNKNVHVTVFGDEIHEYDERFAVVLNQTSPAPISRDRAIGVIINDDLLEISINDIKALEGDHETNVATFSISLSRQTQQYLTGDWSTSNGTAVSGIDYNGSGGYIDYNPAPGETNVYLSIAIRGDSANEDDEFFFANLSLIWGTDVQINNPGKCTIVNDDFFLTPHSVASDQLTFELAGALGATHIIQYSPNLSTWTNVDTNTLSTERSWTFSVPNDGKGFFRAVLGGTAEP